MNPFVLALVTIVRIVKTGDGVDVDLTLAGLVFIAIPLLVVLFRYLEED